jgi:hypothetical protein
MNSMFGNSLTKLNLRKGNWFRYFDWELDDEAWISLFDDKQ